MNIHFLNRNVRFHELGSQRYNSWSCLHLRPHKGIKTKLWFVLDFLNRILPYFQGQHSNTLRNQWTCSKIKRNWQSTHNVFSFFRASRSVLSYCKSRFGFITFGFLGMTYLSFLIFVTVFLFTIGAINFSGLGDNAGAYNYKVNDFNLDAPLVSSVNSG